MSHPKLNVDHFQAVVTATVPFDAMPDGWIVMNAPRPLLGQIAEYGEFLTGIFYVAIDTSLELAHRVIGRNLDDDARMVLIASAELQEAMAVETISPEYRAAYWKMDPEGRHDAIGSFLQELNRGKTYGELKELARRATQSLQEQDLIAQAKARLDGIPLHRLYRIKVSEYQTQEPIIGKWYCHIELVTDEETGRKWERDGNLGQYIGDGKFVDEDKQEIDMSGDLESPWPDYLVQQD